MPRARWDDAAGPALAHFDDQGCEAAGRRLPEGIGSRTVHGHQVATALTRSQLAALMHRAARRTNETGAAAPAG